MPDVEYSVAGWKNWRTWLPWAVGISAAAWLLVRFLPLPFVVADVYDSVFLPVALKGIYGHRPALLVCALIASVLLVLWPHRLRWPALSTLVGVLFVGWLVLLDMWRNAIFSSVAVAAILAYVVSRYLWIPLLRWLPMLGREFFFPLESIVRKQPRCDVLYDAIRAVCWPPNGKGDSTAKLWGRAKAPVDVTGLGGWGRVFGPPAEWYRREHTSRLLPLRLLFGRRAPGSLEFYWLQRLLDSIADEARYKVSMYDASVQEWARQYSLLMTVMEAKAEHLAFSPEVLPQFHPKLVEAAGLYDELSRIGLTRNFWLASAAGRRADETRPDQRADETRKKRIQEHVTWIRNCRRVLIRKAWRLRGLYLGFSDEKLSEENAPLNTALEIADRTGSRTAHELAFAMSYCQMNLLDGEENPAFGELSNKLTVAIRTIPPGTDDELQRLVARKAVELAMDCLRLHAAQDLFALGWIQKHAGASAGEQIDARLEGHLYWRIARTLEHQDVMITAYGTALQAFARGDCDEFEDLRQEIYAKAQMADQ